MVWRTVFAGSSRNLDLNSQNTLRLPVQYVLAPTQIIGLWEKQWNFVSWLSSQTCHQAKRLILKYIVGAKRLWGHCGQLVTVTIVSSTFARRLDSRCECCTQYCGPVSWRQFDERLGDATWSEVSLRTETSNYDCKVAKLRHRININDYTKAMANTLI